MRPGTIYRDIRNSKGRLLCKANDQSGMVETEGPHKSSCKLLGKARFDELLTAYIEKPQGKPTLVPEGDKRPAMNTAKNDFMEENIDE